MKKLVGLVLVSLFFLAACSKGVSVKDLDGVRPGISCSDLETVLEKAKAPFKKEGNKYKVVLKEKAWADLFITCDGVVTMIEYNSAEGLSPKHAQAYIDVQVFLLKTFKGNMIMYEEGNKIVNMGNGIKLHQFYDSKSGAVTHFKISVDNSEGAKLAWNSVYPYLPKIGSGN